MVSYQKMCKSLWCVDPDTTLLVPSSFICIANFSICLFLHSCYFSSRHTGYQWLNTPCDIRAKINSEGYVAIVHHLDTIQVDKAAENSIPLHVSDESLNYFKVYWEGDYPKSSSNDCGECQTLSDGACLCQTTVVDEEVFSSAANVTVAGILSSLSVGCMDPDIYDDSTYTSEEEDGFTAYIKTPGSPGVYDVETVFHVTDENGRTHFLRNVKSTVHLEGWENSYTPRIFEAEEEAYNSSDATNRTEYRWYTGAGWIDFGEEIDQFLEWEVTLAQAVNVNLKFRYTLDNYNRPMEVLVNGVSVNALLDFPPTGAWDYWTYTAPVSVTLSAGTNIIRLQAPSSWPTSNYTVDWLPSTGDEMNGLGMLEQCQVSINISFYLHALSCRFYLLCTHVCTYPTFVQCCSVTFTPMLLIRATVTMMPIVSRVYTAS